MKQQAIARCSPPPPPHDTEAQILAPMLREQRSRTGYRLGIILLTAFHAPWAISPGQAATLPAAKRPASDQSSELQVANGVYLFGDTTKPGQMGHEYMVIQIKGDRVIGGFYEPASEFSCFTGSISPTEINLEIQAPHQAEMLSYRVPLYLNNQVAIAEFVMPFESAFGLQGTYHIEQLDADSRQVLQRCRDEQADIDQVQDIQPMPLPAVIPPEPDDLQGNPQDDLAPMEIYWGE